MAETKVVRKMNSEGKMVTQEEYVDEVKNELTKLMAEEMENEDKPSWAYKLYNKSSKKSL